MFTKRLERMYRPPADIDRYENESYTKNPLLKFRLKDVHEQRHLMFLHKRAAQFKIQTSHEYPTRRKESEQRSLPEWHYVDNLRRSARKIQIPRMLRHIEKKIRNYGCTKYKNRYPQIVDLYMKAVHEHFNQLMYTYSLQSLLKQPEFEDPNASDDMERGSFHAFERKDFHLKSLGRTENYGKFVEKQRRLARQLLLTELPVRTVLQLSEMELPQTICDFAYTFSSHGQLSIPGLGGRNAGPYRAVHKFARNDIEKLTTHLRWTWYPRMVTTLKKMFRRKLMPVQRWNRTFVCIEGLINRQINNMKQASLLQLLSVLGDSRRIPMLRLSLECQSNNHYNLIDISPSFNVILEMYNSIVYEVMDVGKKLEALPPLVNTNLSSHGSPNLKIGMNEIFVREFLSDLRDVLRRTYDPVMKYVENFRAKYDGLCSKKVSEDLDEFLRVPHNFDDYFAKIDAYFRYIRMLLSEPEHDYFEMAVINNSLAVKHLRQLAAALVERIVEHVVREHANAMHQICKDFQLIKERAMEVPKSTEELLESAEYMVLVKKQKIAELRERISYIMKVGNNLVELTEIDEDHMELTIGTINWLNEINVICDYNAAQQEQYKVVFEEHLQDVSKKLNADIVALIPKLSIIDDMSDPGKFRNSYILLQNIIDQLKVFDVYVAWVNKEEKLFKIPKTTYPTLEVLKDFVYPFAALIKLCIDWLRYFNVWLDGPFEYLDPQFVKETTESFLKEFQKNQKYYRNKIKQDLIDQPVCKFRGQTEDPDPEKHPVPLRLCNKMLTAIKDFSTGVFVVSVMCNPALRKRHWKEMSEIAGFDMMPDAGTTLRKILNYGLEGKLEQFEIISISANKEKQLQDNLHSMIAEWDAREFPTGFYKDTGIAILTSLDDIQALLDDHILKTLSMRGSAFMKPCEHEVLGWYERIIRVNRTFDEWGKVQSSFLHLLPIFSSGDIIAQMPEEGRLFTLVEETFNRNMEMILRQPLVMQTAPAFGLLESLENALKLLDEIANGVNNYLERKRLYFPRFFFLSNDEMLEILSETKDPLRVQPHLSKCFEGIHHLHFDEAKDNVLAMSSSERERIVFPSKVSTVAAGGSVEKWLMSVEVAMLKAVRCELELSYADYAKAKRSEWVLKWPQMVILCVSQIFWACNVHASFKKLIKSERPIGEAMAELQAEIFHDLHDLVALIRAPEMSNLNRITLKSLIVVDVHAKDVVEQLQRSQIESEYDFQWLAQLRYYWAEDETNVCIVNARLRYANEYLGNSDRLVITPLTDRCYRTLIAAYQQHLSGAPEGPAATGKTETIKDLAKALAVQCKVFNCSDGLDYKAMGKIFKGLAACGAWACFDEFNRIELEVLSVVAQQMLLILQAIRANAPYFIIENAEIVLNPSCHVCITMNPGYAGRSELPDNLKVLFRPVAMMVPDYALIGEISLYSYGFIDARNLSAKIVTTYGLCSEQLSRQSHYDFGMRAIKSVLAACGHLKRQFPAEAEEVLLLRSLSDVNMPKFVFSDIQLFEGIISDIFPETPKVRTDYSAIEEEFQRYCKEMVLEPSEAFLIKVIQTYEMMLVRHGFMLIGEPLAGKSKTLQILAKILSSLSESKGELNWNFQPVIMTIVNPKAITLSQLFGHFDSVSHEWSDGLVAKIFRDYSMADTLERKWIIFDGPVDTVWIENMNTVLDDNRKLCLTSGEVIALSREMSLIFEVMDLTQASPATVSRCGMIYMEPSALGWRAFANSWLKKCDQRWASDPDNAKYVVNLFQWLLEPCQNFVQKSCHQYVRPGSFNSMMTTFDLFEMQLHDAIEENLEEYQKFLQIYFQAALLYSLVWGVAGILDGESRDKFDAFLKGLWCEENIPTSIGKLDISLPQDGPLANYVYIFKQRGSWKSWQELIKRMDVEVTSLGVQVPTIDTARYYHLLEMHIKHRKRVLLVGPSGTGKSSYMQNLLMNKLDGDLYETSFITFTVNISAKQTQELLISKLFKLKRGIFGPPRGKIGVLFVDDMNMPVKDAYGSQPPLELLRQFFDYGYVYDLKDSSKVNLRDLVVLSACGLPGGSRQDVYSRFLNQFNIFSVNSFTADTVNRIFSNVLLHGFKRVGHGNDVNTITCQIVNATQDIYKSVQEELRATPAKSHYIFNARDIARVVTGCALLKKESVSDRRVFVRLWYHEALRVFCDRLIDEAERSWMFGKLNDCVAVHFKESTENVFESMLAQAGDADFTLSHANQICFGVYFDEDNTADERHYEEVPNLEVFGNFAKRCLEDYNSSRRSKMDITLFEFALQHLNRICRIISIPGANALLIGMSGSGRQSLTKLATNIIQTSFFQPAISKNYSTNDWHADIKQALKEAGGINKHTVFLMTEDQLKNEMFLQDIDCLLNQGEVPNIYAIDEKQEILEMVRLTAQGGNRNIDISPLQVFSFFVNRCKQKLHIVICLSPIGESLRTRIRLYPSLVNCCTIDWYENWPASALQMIASLSFDCIDFPSEQLKESLVVTCEYFHTSAGGVMREFCARTGRHIYQTNASFLELIKSFQSLIAREQKKVHEIKMRYIGGLETLANAADAILKMQDELESLQPKLAQMAENSRGMLVEINKETIAASLAADQVKKDEVIAGVQAAAAQVLKGDCEKDLAKAIPVLEDAIQALNTLKPSDITLVKSMKNPPSVIKLVMAAVCVIKGLPADRIADPTTGKMTNDYWGPSKRVLGDMNFLQTLKDFDKDNINPEIIKKIRKDFIPHKDFHPKIVAKASSAAEGLCKWIIAMDLYDHVAKVVAPKKAKLAAAEDEYANTMEILNEKREMAEALEAKVARLNQELENANAEMKRTQDESDYCQSRLGRAEALIRSLGGEKSRWTEAAESLQILYDNLYGDVLLACGIIAYLSAINLKFRQDCVHDWHARCMAAEIPCSLEFNIRKAFGVDVTIQDWNLNGLPNDIFSIENAIIAQNSSRYTLFIDPQGQANNWIKNMERENRLATVRFNQNNFMKIISEAVEYGYPVIIENVLEDLEASLEPILRHDVFLQGDRKFVCLCDNFIPYCENFRLYMTSNLRNPHFLPEIFNKVTIVNFILTQGALQDQLLGIVVSKERPDLQEMRKNLLAESSANKAALVAAENRILETLSGSDVDILENENAIGILNASKELAIEIKAKQEASFEIEQKIEAFRMNYQPVAAHSAVLYYSITDLPSIDPMYQFSLKWYIDLYHYSIDTANKSKELARRIKFLVDGITRNLYHNVCRSIFEKDKLLFSFMLTCRVLLASGQLRMQHISHLVLDSIHNESESNRSYENPDASWISEGMWLDICHLEDIEDLNGFVDSFKENLTSWKLIYDHSDPETLELPTPWPNRTTRFEKILILRALRPDKVFLALRKFIALEMGEQFITPPEFDIGKSYDESTALTPLIFLLSPGADPLGSLFAFAEKMGKEDTLQCISLGQGQGPIAQSTIKFSQESGNWVCLQNCHLATSWLTTLEYLWENMDTFNTSSAFRLWLTSYPSEHFPIAMLQNGVKMTNDPPLGLKENLIRSYNSAPICEMTFYTGCAKQDRAFIRLLFGICFFHAVVQERRKYGSLGWNISYSFNESDLQISVLQLNMLLNQYNHVPYEALSYLVAECNYGGRVTDMWDRRAIVTILNDYVSPKVVTDARYQFADDERFILPRKSEQREVIRYVAANIPSLPPPEVYGLHANSGITRDMQTTKALTNSIISMLGNEVINGGGKESPNIEDSIRRVIHQIIENMPSRIDFDEVKRKYPYDYNESMNTVLVQELERFLLLQNEILETCHQLEMAIDGDIVMTPELEHVMNAFQLNRVPAKWLKKSYLSLKPLGSYMQDFFKRLKWLSTWQAEGVPSIIWLSGFFFPQAFLTGAKQNFARRHRICIDILTFDFKVSKEKSVSTPSDDGAVFINGLFIEGACWNWQEGHIDEQLPKVLIYEMPIILIQPIVRSELVEGSRYKCPLYKTAERRGILSTTGHSTNYVIPILLESKKESPHWIKRGVALICQTTN